MGIVRGSHPERIEDFFFSSASSLRRRGPSTFSAQQLEEECSTAHNVPISGRGNSYISRMFVLFKGRTYLNSSYRDCSLGPRPSSFNPIPKYPPILRFFAAKSALRLSITGLIAPMIKSLFPAFIFP